MPDAPAFSPDAWPPEMSDLTPMQQMYAVYRSRGLTDAESALAAGFKGATRGDLQRQAWQLDRKPPVAKAIAALKANHVHKETLRYGPGHH